MKHILLYLILFPLTLGQAFASNLPHNSNREVCEQLDCYSLKKSKKVKQAISDRKTGIIEQYVNVYCSQQQNEQGYPNGKKQDIDINTPANKYTTNTNNTPSDNKKVNDKTQNENTSSTKNIIIDAIIKLIASLAWPTTILIIAVIFRNDVTSLLGRITKGKWGPAEIEFANNVRDLESTFDSPGTEQSGPISSSTMVEASDHPRAAILNAWLDVETALNYVTNKIFTTSTSPRPSRGVIPLMREIQKAELIDQKYIALFHELRGLRNEAVHTHNFNPPTDSVISYVKLARELTTALRKAADHVKEPAREYL